MRVLALYDIHGNIDALDALLADPRAADADIVVVGDDALPGPLREQRSVCRFYRASRHVVIRPCRPRTASPTPR